MPPDALPPDDYDLIGNEREIVGRIARACITPADTPWMWSLLTASNHAQQIPRRRDEAMQAAAAAFGHGGWFARLIDGRVVGHAAPAPRIAVRVSPLAENDSPVRVHERTRGERSGLISEAARRAGARTSMGGPASAL